MLLNVTPKMEAVGFSETFVTEYQIARRNISEDSSLRSPVQISKQPPGKGLSFFWKHGTAVTSSVGDNTNKDVERKQQSSKLLKTL